MVDHDDDDNFDNNVHDDNLVSVAVVVNERVDNYRHYYHNVVCCVRHL